MLINQGVDDYPLRRIQIPILKSITDLDFDVWDVGSRLLQKVEQAASNHDRHIFYLILLIGTCS
jgi:hypothetical protein